MSKRSILMSVSAVALMSLIAHASIAAEVDTIAILTPEPGTDFGWNQQGIEAAKAAAEAAGVEVIVAENLGYGDGADLIIAHASGYNTAAPEIGAEMTVPVAIVDSPDAMSAGAVADYTLSGHEGAYLAGRLAAKMSRSGTVGIVVSGEPPSWNSQSAAFADGVKAENPDATVRYAVIGPAAYADAAGGKRVTETLIAAGADVIFGQGNGSSFGMLQAIETTAATDGGKVLFIDVIGDKSSIDKGFLLSSVIWDMAPVYTAMIEDLKSDSFGTKNYSIGLADDSVRLLKTPQIPDDVWAEIEGIREEIISGAITVEPVWDAEGVHQRVTAVE
jgi:basic membrane protein A